MHREQGKLALVSRELPMDSKLKWTILFSMGKSALCLSIYLSTNFLLWPSVSGIFVMSNSTDKIRQLNSLIPNLRLLAPQLFRSDQVLLSFQPIVVFITQQAF